MCSIALSCILWLAKHTKKKKTKFNKMLCCRSSWNHQCDKTKGNRVFCVQMCRREVEKYKVACACEASHHHLCVHLSTTVLSPSHTHRAVDFIGLLNCLYREYYNSQQLAALNISEYALFVISRIAFIKEGYRHTGGDVC